ncbi:MAG: hypothetical protein FWH10_09315, partial [Oscillospiraceae bacterium]|nr:hypothetical protein [Oscillospiraceae bacterium]
MKLLCGFDFTQLQDFGQIMHDNIYAWYADETEAKLWRTLLNHINFIKEEENKTMNINTNTPFFGKSIVATGKLQNYTRDGIQMKLISLGAKPADSVLINSSYTDDQDRTEKLCRVFLKSYLAVKKNIIFSLPT